MSLVLALALAAGRWWVHVHEMAWFLFAVFFCMSLVVLVWFAFAGVGWALYALLRRSPYRRAASRAFVATVFMLIIVGGYALVFTGVIRLR
jgi:hypothetical protein